MKPGHPKQTARSSSANGVIRGNSRANKLVSLLFALCSMLCVGLANASVDMTIYYSPTCPHCHHAIEFATDYLVYEYPSLTVNKINVMTESNRPAFDRVIKECNLQSGGVPIITINGKCFQGFGMAETTGNQFRETIDAAINADERTNAESVRAAMSENADAVRAQNPDRRNAIVEKSDTQKKTENSPMIFWAILVVLVAALAFVVLRKRKN